jgi:hypothetical protein
MKVMWQAQRIPENMMALLVAACQSEQKILVAAEGAAYGSMPGGTKDAACGCMPQETEDAACS